MNKLPEHVEAQLHRLIEEGLPVDQIAFMMRLSRKTVESEIEPFNTTKTKLSPKKR